MILASGRQPSASNVWKDISIDPNTIARRYHLDPVVHPYICCPSCFALYPPDSAPNLCTSRDVDKGPCSAALFQTRVIRAREHRAAIRYYYHQDMKEWMARFLSRPEIDTALDSVPNGMSDDGYIVDIWGGDGLRSFLGPDGRTPFITPASRDGSLRLVFGLGIDGFNSYRNIQAKKKASSTGIYLVCLNLPPEMRYLPENIYLVGVVPGPNKPNLDQLNPILDLLVKDLNEFWTPGVRYTRTANHPNGRHVNAALVPLVSDLQATRQTAGFSFPRHRLFCSYCYLQKSKIEDFDKSKWPPRTLARHRQAARAWKEASDGATRKDILDNHGVRWSSLLNLPYWNPLKFAVVDSMHNHYLGLLQNHIRAIWGINVEKSDGEGYTDPVNKVPPRPKDEDMQMGDGYLIEGDRKKLLSLKSSVLYHLCVDRDLRRGTGKKDMVRDLLASVSNYYISFR